MSDPLTDPYVNTENDNFPGARQRSRPGEGPREEIYGKKYDAKGNLVSAKPANSGLLSSQRKRLEHERKVADSEPRRAQDHRPSANSRISWTSIFVLSLFIPLLSSFLTGSSYSFHLAPKVVTPVMKWWRFSPYNPFRAHLQKFTPEKLALFDGRKPDRPLYIALGGEVYDVSANRRIYGPGGSYSMMAGRDISRAYITGCFQTDLTHDLRGLSDKDLQALENWKSFFANHEKYKLVGHVLNEPIDPRSPIPPDCRKGAAGGEKQQTHAGKAKGHPRPDPVKATGS